MKVLLLHPEDTYPPSGHSGPWDLIVDLARAPRATYERWSREAGCQVISLYDFAEEIEDLYRLKRLVSMGMGQVVDGMGIDWWDVLSLMIVPDLHQILLLQRLAKELPRDGELYSTRPQPLASAVQELSGGRLIILNGGIRAKFSTLAHYRDVFSHLDRHQLAQIVQDKLDRHHYLRRRLAFRHRRSDHPVVLLPSAYVNVSRTAVSYAAMLPDQQFLLVCGRAAGRWKHLPPNTAMASLDPYFTPSNRAEVASLQGQWDALKVRLIFLADELRAAESSGVLQQISGRLTWGIAIRDAWIQLLRSENIVACLSADDSNPYTRIPLMLARLRGLPALACHHGALDWAMAVKMQHADFYLAKGEMERDYLVRVCQVAPRRIICGAADPAGTWRPEPPMAEPEKKWLVFFTEPYQAVGWRADEVYRELLPRLSALAQRCELQLAFKLHPFDSVKGHRRLLHRYLPPEQAKQVEIIAGAPSSEVWRRARVAVTVQSTVALECTARGVPVFLCAWLRDARTGYLRQLERFGIGRVLQCADQLEQIPQMLAQVRRVEPAEVWRPLAPQTLRELIAGTYAPPVAEPPLTATSRAGA